MSITIPAWLLWTLGILVSVPLVVGLIVFAVIGVIVSEVLKEGIWK